MSTQSLNQGGVVQRLARARAVMSQNGIYALLVPSADPHLSEYLPEYWQGRQWLSGFHGSVGTLIITPTFAGVWADSRYWEQATKELAGSQGRWSGWRSKPLRARPYRLTALSLRWPSPEPWKVGLKSAVHFYARISTC